MQITYPTACVVVSVLLLILVPPALAAKIIYVDADATGANNGSSWTDAYNYLQDALMMTSAGDEILVAQGVYKPDQFVLSKRPNLGRAETFHLKNGLTIRGGYAGFGEPEPDARNINAYETTLSGDLAGNDVLIADPCDLLEAPARSDNSYHVVMATDCDHTALIDGFTITAGNANGPALVNQSGGGLYDGKPTVTNCKIINNAAYYHGGGIWFAPAYHGPTGTASNSIISNNSAQAGGGIYGCAQLRNCIISENSATEYSGGGAYLGSSCETTITDCIISNNSAIVYAGGVFIGYSDSRPIFTRCTFIENSVAGRGGAVAVDGCTCGSYPEFFQCKFIANFAAGNGGAVYDYGYSFSQFASCILVGNYSGGDGGAICDGYDGGSSLVNCALVHNTSTGKGGAICYDSYSFRGRKLTNSIVWHNSDSSGQTGQDSQIYIKDSEPPSIRYCCIQVLPSAIAGASNIDDDPLFADTDGVDDTPGNEDDDLHLLPGSPCIDAGNNAAVDHSTDLDGNARLVNDRVDMGAYELRPPPPIVPGHEWRYFKGIHELPANWNELSFDDSTWLRGPTGIGYGDGDDATILDDMRDSCVSIYARRLFYVDQPSVVTSLLLTVDYDDAFVAYINGVEVARSNVDGNPPLFNTVANDHHEASAGDNDPNPPEHHDISAFIDQLAAGMNLLAVQGHNVGLASSDFSLIPSLFVGAAFHVDDDAPNDPGPGDPTVSDPFEDGTQAHPFDTIQEAIDNAGYSDSIIVLDGTYSGNGNRDIDFYGKAITVRSQNGPENCTINPNGTEEQPHRAFHFHGNETASSVLDGFTITNGYARSGGAIYCEGQSSPTLANCIITGNSAEYEGGGLYNQSGNPTLIRCTFTKNWSTQDGGGMQNDDGSPTLTNCAFIANSAGDEGGGMCNEDDHLPPRNPKLTNCIFIANSATYGGGLCNDESNPALTNCTFSGNTATENGGAIYLDEGGAAILTNCILWDDAPQEVYMHLLSGVSSATYTNIQDGWPGATNMSVDPCFAAPGHWDPNGTPDEPSYDFWVQGNYHLKSQAGRWDASEGRWRKDDLTSPCIDAGNPMSPIGHEPFPNGGIINMGAYGGTAEASKSYFGEPVCKAIVAGDINGDCIVDLRDFCIMALHWLEDNSS